MFYSKKNIIYKEHYSLFFLSLLLLSYYLIIMCIIKNKF